MKRSWLLAVLLIAGATGPRAAPPTITIDASAPAGKVSPLLYGLMTAESNHGYVVRERSGSASSRCFRPPTRIRQTTSRSASRST